MATGSIGSPSKGFFTTVTVLLLHKERARFIHYCHDIVPSNSSGCYGPRAVCGGPHDRMDPSSDIRVWDRLNQSIV